MPNISQFYGIKIYIFYEDHNEPHFHAYYVEDEAEISIKSGDIIAGTLSPHARKLVKKWMKEHKQELEADWNLAREHKKRKKIEPLQ
jgi:hypothetical protein